MEHTRGIKIQEAVSLWREIDPSVKNKSYHALRSKIRRAAKKGVIDTAWFSGDSYKLYKNTDVVKFAKSQMKSEPVTNCNQTEQPTSDCSQLPKLTAEVFDRPVCPEWAKWAAVDADRCGFYYEDKPRACEADGEWLVDKCVVGTNRIITGYFDPTNWQNSLIERPVKSLPDWCKVGEWVFHRNILTRQSEYFEIAEIKGHVVIPTNGEQYFFTALYQARLRPYNGDEVPVLPFEVRAADSNFRTTVVSCDGVNVWLGGASIAITTEELAHEFTFANGSPCGVLEHLENGEWVK